MEIFRKFRPKPKFFEILTEIEIFRKLWPKSIFFLENFTKIGIFPKNQIYSKDQNRNFSKIWTKSKFFEIFEKIENFRKFDQNRNFSKFWKKSQIFL